MSFVAVGVGGAALVGGVAGAVISSNAAGNAADKQTSAANYATDLQKQEYDQTRQDQQPWRDAGSAALSQMGDPSFSQTFNPTDMETVDPGYNFRMQQGQQALERSAAARGGLQSGGTMKAITQYGQDYASGEYQNAYNRFTNDQTNRFNRLSSIAGLGQTANAATAQAGQTYATAAGNNATGAANAQGAAGIASANAYGGAINGALNTGTSMYALSQMPNWMKQSGGGMGGGYNPGFPGGPNQSVMSGESYGSLSGLA